MEAGLGSLAPARTSPDVGFNERSLLSLVIPTTLDLKGRLREGLTVWHLTVRHIIGAVEDLGRFARGKTPTAVNRHRLHLKEVLAFELQILQLVAGLILESAYRNLTYVESVKSDANIIDKVLSEKEKIQS